MDPAPGGGFEPPGKVPDTELRDALRVFFRHLSDSPTLDRNEISWSLFEDDDTSYGLSFGVYRF